MISIKAAFAGWIVFVVCVFCVALASAIFNPHAWANSGNPFVAPLLFSVGSAAVVLVVWVVLALPLALLVPDYSAFWKPPILTLIGATVGPVLVCLNVIHEIRSNGTETIYNLDDFYFGDVILPCFPAAFIGGIVGGVAAHLHKRFRKA